MDKKKILEQIELIAKMAGQAILEIYAQKDSWGVEMKSDDSPLTKADKKSNEVIMYGLQAITPEIPVISEENKSIDWEKRTTFTKCWMVDPLDGTKEFIKRNGEFTVNIALLENNIPTLAVVFTPVSDDLYSGIKGIGAWWTVGNERKELSAPEFTMKDEGLGVVCSRSHMNEETQAFVDQLTDPVLVSSGSSLKLMLLARGDAHIYPRIAPTMEWDTAAAHCVLDAAGGKVIQYGTDQELAYNKENLLNPFFVAYARLK
jgi:3'(2'), 5'-bisphosphate nucleotidase